MLLQRVREQNLKLYKRKLKLCLPEVYIWDTVCLKMASVPIQTRLKLSVTYQGLTARRQWSIFRLLAVPFSFPTTISKSISSSETVNRAVSHIHMANSTRRSILAMIIKAPVLKFYDVKAEVTIQCDTSEKGLGATLLQNKQLVAFVSQSLTTAEQNYAQIEKECLAIVFACERFYQYTHGCE